MEAFLDTHKLTIVLILDTFCMSRLFLPNEKFYNLKYPYNYIVPILKSNMKENVTCTTKIKDQFYSNFI